MRDVVFITLEISFGNLMKNRFTTLVIILMCVCCTNLWAAPAAPVEIELVQPDGTTFMAIPRGDEYANWVYVRYVPSDAEVSRIHDGGQQVFIAGPNVAGEEIDNWKKVAKSGVDGILTDYPLSLKRVLRRRARPPQ